MQKVHLDIKPLTINQAYRGRRYASQWHKKFKQDVFRLLPKSVEIPKGKLKVAYTFGVSSKGSDVDNLIKAFQDCIAEMYRFNDKIIYKLEVEKVDVTKGKEFIEFEISTLSTGQ